MFNVRFKFQLSSRVWELCDGQKWGSILSQIMRGGCERHRFLVEGNDDEKNFATDYVRRRFWAISLTAPLQVSNHGPCEFKANQYTKPN
jgi:hypothetical protein